jgi:hypothetical protein
MAFDFSSFSLPVQAVLASRTDHILPLIRGKGCASGDLQTLQKMKPPELFPAARHPEAALSGLFLYLDCWEASHELSQGIESGEGSYWHGIAHRMEPDAGNARYWFRRVGAHPVFPALHAEAGHILDRYHPAAWRLPSKHWDPLLFIDWCEQARLSGGTAEAQTARAIQTTEWRLMFDWCGKSQV